LTCDAHPDRRYDSDFLTLKRLCSEQAFGKVLEAEFHHDLQDPPWLTRLAGPRRQGSGMAYTAGSHVIDQALTLFGLPAFVTGFFHSFTQGVEENEDSYTITMEYDSGLVVHIKTNAVSIMPKVLTYLIRGSQGSFIKFGTDPQLGHHLSGIAATDPAFGMEDEEDWGQLSTSTRARPEQTKIKELWVGKIPSEKGNWAGYYQDLASTLLHGEPLQVEPEQARHTIRVIELAWESVVNKTKVPFL
jgi:scyllo-inositol 2-dehydrogenase (NADP+)